MNRRTFVCSGLFLGLVVAASTASAKDAGWDGVWEGTTAKGGSVVVTVSGGEVSYTFRGSDVPVNSASVSANALTLKVGSMNGVVRLTKSGGTAAAYSYSDTSGGSASATLKRR